eukprot:15661627-Heterocapsa_arctica.AAC.1
MREDPEKADRLLEEVDNPSGMPGAVYAASEGSGRGRGKGRRKGDPKQCNVTPKGEKIGGEGKGNRKGSSTQAIREARRHEELTHILNTRV